MHKLTSSALLGHVFLLAGISSTALAQDFCAVTVHIQGPDRKPITSTWFELRDPSEKVVRKAKTGPNLRLCDFGFGPHRLTVGANECLPITISDLRVFFGHPVTLDVTLNPCSYGDELGGGCLLYLRVADAKGDPISDINLSSATLRGTSHTDAYGRFQAHFKGSLNITYSKPGFEAGTFQLQCRDNEEIDKDLTIGKSGQ
jgi:hypothetical protein